MSKTKGSVRLPSYGVFYYEVKLGNTMKKIGFFYPEVIWNLVEDKGNKGISVREIRLSTEGKINDKTIRKILQKYMDMGRIVRHNVNEAPKSKTKLPNYRYIIKRRWLHIL